MTVPFEGDSIALLEACAVGLSALSAVRTGQDTGRRAPGILPQERNTVVQPASVPAADSRRSFGRGERYEFPAENAVPQTQPQTTIMSAEAISKAVERDARRFGG